MQIFAVGVLCLRSPATSSRGAIVMCSQMRLVLAADSWRELCYYWLQAKQ